MHGSALTVRHESCAPVLSFGELHGRTTSTNAISHEYQERYSLLVLVDAPP
jgi:hypothetical protein